MDFKQLGTTSEQVSRVGFGCAPMSGYDYGPVDEAACSDAVEAALEQGVNLFDVADVYGFGRAEEWLSRALGSRRHEVVIATKFGLKRDADGGITRDAGPAAAVRALEASLRRLRLDVIPLYQIHWPDPHVPLAETFDALAECHAAGKIRHIGVSNFSVALLRTACKLARIQCIQIEYNLLCRHAEIELLDWCASSQISVLAYSGLARGLLSGKYALPVSFLGTDTRRRSPYFSLEGSAQKQQLLDGLRRIGGQTGHSPAAAALRWVMDDGRITTVLAGSKNRAQLEENVSAAGWQLSNRDRAFLTDLSDACAEDRTSPVLRKATIE
jgi:aryl-alcohol dehydrogenase-like predicted oxidoreductase